MPCPEQRRNPHHCKIAIGGRSPRSDDGSLAWIIVGYFARDYALLAQNIAITLIKHDRNLSMAGLERNAAMKSVYAATAGAIETALVLGRRSNIRQSNVMRGN